jgi:hypothetical protein
MTKLPIPNLMCEEERRKCLCIQTAKTGRSTYKLVSQTRSIKHGAYCTGQVTLCSIAWLSISGPKVINIPGLENLSPAIAAACIVASEKLEKFEKLVE